MKYLSKLMDTLHTRREEVIPWSIEGMVERQ